MSAEVSKFRELKLTPIMEGLLGETIPALPSIHEINVAE